MDYTESKETPATGKKAKTKTKKNEDLDFILDLALNIQTHPLTVWLSDIFIQLQKGTCGTLEGRLL